MTSTPPPSASGPNPGPGSWPAAPVPDAVDPRSLPAALQPALPVVESDYFAFFRAPRWRWWRPLLAALMGGVLFILITGVLGVGGIALDGTFDEMAQGEMVVGPWTFLGNNLGLALCIPLAMFTAWACFQQRPRWLSSVAGGFRWLWFGRVLAFVVPLWAAFVTFSFLAEPPVDVRWREYSLLMIAGVILTTPLQAAGEEYLVRGILGRMVASYVPQPVVGFVLSTAVTASVFVLLHAAADPWLNLMYVVFALVGSWVTWRTGGLEAAVAIHMVNNVLSEVFLPFTDFSDMFDRQEGAADASILLNVAVLLVAVVLVEFAWRRRPGVRTSAPGRPQLDATVAAIAAQRAQAWPGWQGQPPQGWQGAPPQGWQGQPQQPGPQGWQPPPPPPGWS